MDLSSIGICFPRDLSGHLMAVNVLQNPSMSRSRQRLVVPTIATEGRIDSPFSAPLPTGCAGVADPGGGAAAGAGVGTGRGPAVPLLASGSPLLGLPASAGTLFGWPAKVWGSCEYHHGISAPTPHHRYHFRIIVIEIGHSGHKEIGRLVFVGRPRPYSPGTWIQGMSAMH